MKSFTRPTDTGPARRPLRRGHRRTLRSHATAGATVLAMVGSVLTAASAAQAAAPNPQDGPGTEPARQAIERLAPQLADRFVLHRKDFGGSDGFTIGTDRGMVSLAGNTNASLISAFSRYLEDDANGQIARGPDHIPNSAPPPRQTSTVTSPYKYRYINNFTVAGYTSPNWDWTQWQAELDQLAAHGVNMALVTVGQEALWVDTFKEFGYSPTEVRNWIVPTSHQPWQWMGNIEATNSGLTSELIERRAALGRKVIDRMRELGITPVLPGYSGIVPPGFADRNPGAHVVEQGQWNGQRRPDWLDSSSDDYQAVAAAFYAHQRERFGITHAHAVDLLHEGGATGGVPLSDAAQGVQRAMRTADPGYLWVIQAWQANPRKELIDALDDDRLLVLDLTHGQWQGTDAFHGAPWAWGELGNFGGRLGLFGHMDQIAQDLPAAATSPSRGRLSGIALMNEGLEQDPIVEQLWSRMSWQRNPVDLDQWVTSYVRARYGRTDPQTLEAWQLLLTVAYSVNDSRRADSVLNAHPDLNATRAAQRQPNRLPYDPTDVEHAWHLMLDVAPRMRQVPTFQHDLVDVTRQVIVNRGRVILPEVKASYEAGDLNGFRDRSADFLRLMDLEEQILSTRFEFMFGPWVDQAASWGTTNAETDTLVSSAKRLLTIWSLTRPGFENLTEYANRDWAGLISGYYKPRWVSYFASLDTALQTGKPPQAIDWFHVGKQFVFDKSATFADQPHGDPVAVAQEVAAQLPTG
jgi:hypothetical protein